MYMSVFTDRLFPECNPVKDVVIPFIPVLCGLKSPVPVSSKIQFEKADVAGVSKL
jgi:hypothetical protein